jgi:lipoprotein-anchoring transpeptidase ErfK/SrfK
VRVPYSEKIHRPSRLLSATVVCALALASACTAPGLPGPSHPPRLAIPSLAVVAEAKADRVDIFDAPWTAQPSRTLPNPWFVNDDPTTPVPQVFLVDQQRADGWSEILLPVRPNGLHGWVRTNALRLFTDPYRVNVVLSTHTIEVTNGAALLYHGPVASGARATPTPTGDYYLRALLRAPNTASVYGPYAYGLSAHSDALSSFNGGDAEVGIHGNNDAAALGHDVTHGCIRIDNAEISVLATILPLGTPVHISA